MLAAEMERLLLKSESRWEIRKNKEGFYLCREHKRSFIHT